MTIERCQCESSHCDHGLASCFREAILEIATIYGKYKMCLDCAANLPDEYYKKGGTPE